MPPNKDRIRPTLLPRKAWLEDEFEPIPVEYIPHVVTLAKFDGSDVKFDSPSVSWRFQDGHRVAFLDTSGYGFAPYARTMDAITRVERKVYYASMRSFDKYIKRLINKVNSSAMRRNSSRKDADFFFFIAPIEFRLQLLAEVIIEDKLQIIKRGEYDRGLGEEEEEDHG